MYGHKFAGGGMFRDDETHEMIDVEYLKQCFYEMADLLQFIQNVETGMITISMREYIELPPVVSIAWGIYKRETNKKRQFEIEQLRLKHGT